MTTIPQCPFCASSLGPEHWRMSFLFPSQHLCSRISFGLITEYHLTLHLLNYFRPTMDTSISSSNGCMVSFVYVMLCENSLVYIKWTDMISLMWIIHPVSIPCVNHTWCKERKRCSFCTEKKKKKLTRKLLVNFTNTKKCKCCIELNMEFWSRKSEMVL